MSDYSGSMCPIGKYCPKGQPPAWCPPGKKREKPGAPSPDYCEACKPGFYCAYGSTEYGGVPCRPSYYCPSNGTGIPCTSLNVTGISCDERENCTDKELGAIGAANETICIGGHWCPAMTGDPKPCPAGYYCPANSSEPTPCDYPWYCPAKSDERQICPLGHKAVTKAGNRTSAKEFCMLCPPGFYGNDPERKNCTQCPEGYFCPAGTKDGYENPCPVGYYCPAGSFEPVSQNLLSFHSRNFK